MRILHVVCLGQSALYMYISYVRVCVGGGLSVLGLVRQSALIFFLGRGGRSKCTISEGAGVIGLKCLILLHM